MEAINIYEALSHYCFPPRVPYREKEKKEFRNLITDSLNYKKTDIVYKDEVGKGKRVLLDSEGRRIASKLGLCLLQTDCSLLDSIEILHSLLQKLKIKVSFDFDLQNKAYYTDRSIWKHFENTVSKIDRPLLILLTNVDQMLDSKLVHKFLDLKINSNLINIFSLHKTKNIPYLSILSKYDYRKRLYDLKYEPFLGIATEWCNWVFPTEINPEIIEQFTLLTYEHSKPYPRKIVEIIQDAYPILIDNSMHSPKINAELMFDIYASRIYDGDYFRETIYKFLSSSSFFIKLMFTNIIQEFENRNFITTDILKEVYIDACELRKKNPNDDHFYEVIILLIKNYILQNSRRKITVEALKDDKFSLLLGPRDLEETLKASLKKPLKY